MNAHRTRKYQHSNNCPKCGSRNWQRVEIAYDQSVRRTTGGYESVSRFAYSISPPPKRSLIGGPLFSAAGMTGGTLVFLPGIVERDHLGIFSPTQMMEPFTIKAALLVGAIVFVVRFVAAVRYNSTRWPAMHNQWRNGWICRSCGHQLRSDTKSGDHQ